MKEIIPFLQEDVDGLVATYLDSVLHKLITVSLRLMKIAVELQDFSTLYLGGLGGGTMAESIVESFAVFCRYV